MNMDRFIESVVATADAVRARGAAQKRINLSFDEWNVWYHAPVQRRRPEAADVEWRQHPRLIEDEYTVTDAVVVGTFLNSLLRHGDRVTVACQAQLVNVIGLLRSEPGGEAWKQTIAYPFEQMRRLARGQILQVVATSISSTPARYTDVPLVDASATYDAETGRAAVFVANRSLTESAELSVDLRSMRTARVLGSSTLHAQADQDRHASNGITHDAVTPEPFDAFTLSDGQLDRHPPAAVLDRLRDRNLTVGLTARCASGRQCWRHARLREVARGVRRPGLGSVLATSEGSGSHPSRAR